MRKTHILRLVRKVEIWRRTVLDLKNSQIEIIKDFLAGEAIAIASQALDISYAINDWRTEAVIEFEKGMWRKYLFTKEYENFQNYRLLSPEDCFVKALNILKKPKQTLAFLYHAILVELSKFFVFQRDWDQARLYLKESYRHCKELVQSLLLDEKSLQLCKNEPESSCKSIELYYLSNADRNRIHMALMQDYKVITSRLMLIAEQLSDLSLEQISKWTAHCYSTSWRSRHHILSGKLNRAKEKCENNRNIIAELDSIGEMVNKWASENIEYLKINSLDLVAEVHGIIDNSIVLREFRNRISIKNTIGSKVTINFSVEVLRIIIENIVLNIHEAGFMFNKDWDLKIEFAIKNDFIFFLFLDNIGKFQEFSKIIDLINNFVAPRSTKGSSHGNGLILIKKLIRDISSHSKKWAVTQDGNWKILWIPLSKKISTSLDYGE